MFGHRQLPQGNMHLNVDERDMIKVPKQAVLYYLFIYYHCDEFAFNQFE